MQEQIDQHIDRLLSYMKEEAYKPLTVQELEEALAIEDSADFKEFCKGACKNGRKGACRSNEKQSLWFAPKNESDSWEINWTC